MSEHTSEHTIVAAPAPELSQDKRVPAADVAPLAPTSAQGQANELSAANGAMQSRSSELARPADGDEAGGVAAGAAATGPVPDGTAEDYVVISGDTLSKISNDHYGRPTLWRAIHENNRSVIGGNAHRIHPNQLLVLPGLEYILATSNHRATMQEAFEIRWGVEVDRERGAARIPASTFRVVHDQLLLLPAQDAQGTWTKLLHLNNSSGGWMSAEGEFGLGEDAAGGTLSMGQGNWLLSDAAAGDTTIEFDGGALFGPGVNITLGTGATAETHEITAVDSGRTVFTLDVALTGAHLAGTDLFQTNNAPRTVPWLEAVVRHEIGHAVETAIGGVTGLTETTAGWWTGSDIDAWAALMGDPWATNDGTVITDPQKTEVKDHIDALRTAPTTAGLNDGLDATHAINTLWSKDVPLIEAAKPMADTGGDYWQSSQNYFGAAGKFFTINDYYEEFHAFGDAAQFNQVRSYSTYAPGEFFAELYCVYYEQAGSVPDSELGQLIPVPAWRDWIKTNVHDRGHVPTPAAPTASP